MKAKRPSKCTARCSWCGWTREYPDIESTVRGLQGHQGATLHTLGCRIALQRIAAEARAAGEGPTGIIARLAAVKAGERSVP